MWMQGLKRLPKQAGIRSVFVVGDIGEGCMQALRRRYQEVDVEPGDGKVYDLLCVSLPSKPMKPEEAKALVDSLSARLAPDGYLLAPAFGIAPELAKELVRTFSRQPRRWFETRELNLFRPHGNGTLGDPMPPGYVNYLTTHEYLVRDCSGEKSRFEVVDGHGVTGTRWHYGPLWFEKYYGDIEPTPDVVSGPMRMLIWQPISRLDTPKGWTRTRLAEHTQQTGFAPVTPEYWKRWTSHAQRHRTKWRKLLAAGEWEVVEVTPDEFIAAYRKAKMDPVLKFLFIDLIKEKYPTQGRNQHFWGVKRKGREEIEAGFVANDIPESKQSKHFISFIQESAKKDPVGTGLMDVWFEHAVKTGLQFLDFGVFWAPGDPKAWQGFSKFKAQFGIYFIRFPRPLVRQAGSWKALLRSMALGLIR